MIKKFRSFNGDIIKKGDYVYLDTTKLNTDGYGASENHLKKLSEFLQNNIGIVSEINDNAFYIKYYNIPDVIILFFTYQKLLFVTYNNIKHHSENLEKLKVMIKANKYNI
jgi:hypothetical protein